MRKKDNTFFIIAVFLSLMIPVSLLFSGYVTTCGEWIMAAVSVFAVDGLCYLAHRSVNKKC